MATVGLLINIDVPDLEEAVEFYQRAVGLRLGRRLFDGTVAEMVGASVPIYLVVKEPGSSPSSQTSQRRAYSRHWTPVHLDFMVEDIERTVEKALAAGAKLEANLQSFAWGRLATMSDPFGHGLCLLQWNGRGYDEVA
jgi:predicted enzyme related to lactoylglutathione lyase